MEHSGGEERGTGWHGGEGMKKKEQGSCYNWNNKHRRHMNKFKIKITNDHHSRLGRPRALETCGAETKRDKNMCFGRGKSGKRTRPESANK